MKLFLKPNWIIPCFILPTVFLLFLFYSTYHLIFNSLEADAIFYWKLLFASTILQLVAQFSYYIFFLIKKQTFSRSFGIVNTLFNTLLIYFYSVNFDQLIPFDIPSWTVERHLDLLIVSITFIEILFSLLIIVLLQNNKVKKTAWLKQLSPILIPIGWYSLIMIAMSYVSNTYQHEEVEYHLFLLALTGFIVLFIYGFINLAVILVKKRQQKLTSDLSVLKVFIVLIFPIISLFFNNYLDYDGNGASTQGMFGNFNHPLFYFLVAFNGIVILLPTFKNLTYRFLKHLLVCFTFPIIIYFFIVFIPYLPLSILLIFALFLGVLMLNPLILFFIQLLEIVNEFTYLSHHIQRSKLYIMSTVSFLIIPISLYLSMLNDRKVIHQTLDYVYNSNTCEYTLNTHSLARVIDKIENNKQRNGILFSLKNIPLIDKWYSSVVLQNQSLSSSKIGELKRTLLGENTYRDRQINTYTKSFFTSEVTQQKSYYDSHKKHWISNVELKITNKNNTTNEYNTSFYFPQGAYVTDYYLMIEGKKEKGILAEKKTAQWIYNSIVTTRKDPGLLKYIQSDSLQLNVFPVNLKDPRITGVEIIHKDPFVLEIDSLKITLGTGGSTYLPLSTPNYTYLSSTAKNNLSSVIRKGYFHYLIDASTDNYNQVTSAIQFLNQQYPSYATSYKTSVVGNSIHSINKETEKELITQQISKTEGFFLDRAIKSILIQNYQSQQNAYPIFVILSSKNVSNYLSDNYANLQMCFPESQFIYQLNSNKQLEAYNLAKKTYEIQPEITSITISPTTQLLQLKDGEKKYLANDSLSMIIPHKIVHETQDRTVKSENKWDVASEQFAGWQTSNLSAFYATEQWKSIVKNSFTSRILTPETAFISLENETQKKVLLKKQKEVLSANKAFDVETDAQQMSEPGYLFIVLSAGLGLVLYFRIKNKRNQRSSP